ncbi:uncharacterized protein RCO7_07074 [Rhynchosporium graminicola]|uniref:CFEM domain-containing protein n=1 Tax=Rhynchosporium graminicola TaxID=2792576 RepID=A0A1E1K0D7_9HELO|nr:uncharacterized protein RCO7_07074 [Rhynchosporium commune]
MKTFTAFAVLAAGAELASATFFDFPKFNCPANTDNKCNPQQSSGFDWTDLELGSFESYGQFSFSGWECAGSFGSERKRDLISGRTFKDKCITGKAHHDKSKSPSFSCGNTPDVKDFSVVEFEVSVEFDCELEFYFEMPNGSSCKQKTHCSKGGSVVRNRQCGGATSVTVVYPPQQQGPGVGRTDCELGVHHIAFDCNPASPPVYPTRSTTMPALPEVTPPSDSETDSGPFTTDSPDEDVSTVSKPEEATSTADVVFASPSSISVPEITPTANVPVPTPVIMTSSTFLFSNTSSNVGIPSLPAQVVSSSSEAIITPSVPTTSAVGIPSPSSTSTAPVDIITVIITTSTTVCPFTSTHVTGGLTSTEVGITTSTITLTSTSTICTKCNASPVSSTPGSPVVTPGPVANTPIFTKPAGPVEPAPCPDVLPSCLNTWLFISGCASNTDSSCYCPSSKFVSNVFECLSAYAKNDDEISRAQQYLQGICAPHIGQNPAIITGATTTLNTTMVPTQTPVPVTTIEIFTTVTVPCVESTGSLSGSTMSGTSTVTLISTYLTVPQVVFQTLTATTSGGAGGANLVAGTPAPAPASPTNAGPISIPSGTLSVSRTGAPSGTGSPIPFAGGAAQLSFGFSAVLGAFVIAMLAL